MKEEKTLKNCCFKNGSIYHMFKRHQNPTALLWVSLGQRVSALFSPSKGKEMGSFILMPTCQLPDSRPAVWVVDPC